MRVRHEVREPAGDPAELRLALVLQHVLEQHHLAEHRGGRPSLGAVVSPVEGDESGQLRFGPSFTECGAFEELQPAAQLAADRLLVAGENLGGGHAANPCVEHPRRVCHDRAPMAHKFVFLMDPIDRIDIDADSTFVLMLESNKRGHEVFYAGVESLELADRVYATVRPAEMRRVRGDHVTLGDPVRLCLDDVDAVFMRKDPPIETDYFLATLILDRVAPHVVMINDPQALRDYNEKLAALYFRDWMPPTIVTADRARLRKFVDEVQMAVIKPLSGAGGAGILRVSKGDPNLGSALDLLTLEGQRMIEGQAFIEAIEEGDKRIILLDGEPIGAVNRIPQKGDIRANMHVGGSAVKSALTERDLEICRALEPEMKRRGLLFVGIDVIGGFLTEVNVTSPTGLQEINRFDGVRLEALIIDRVEEKRRMVD